MLSLVQLKTEQPEDQLHNFLIIVKTRMITDQKEEDGNDDITNADYADDGCCHHLEIRMSSV